MKLSTAPEGNDRENAFANASGTLQLDKVASTIKFAKTGIPSDEHDKDYSRTLMGSSARYYEAPAALRAQGTREELTFHLTPRYLSHSVSFKSTRTIPRCVDPGLETERKFEEFDRHTCDCCKIRAEYRERMRAMREEDSNQVYRNAGTKEGDVPCAVCVKRPVIKTRNPRMSYWAMTGDPFSND